MQMVLRLSGRVIPNIEEEGEGEEEKKKNDFNNLVYKVRIFHLLFAILVGWFGSSYIPSIAFFLAPTHTPFSLALTHSFALALAGECWLNFQIWGRKLYTEIYYLFFVACSFLLLLLIIPCPRMTTNDATQKSLLTWKSACISNGEKEKNTHKKIIFSFPFPPIPSHIFPRHPPPPPLPLLPFHSLSLSLSCSITCSPIDTHT